MTGEPGRPGVRVGSSLIDQGTGTWAALGVLAALLERERTGEGTVVDVSLYETAIGYIGYHLAGYLADGTVPHGQGTRFPMVAPVPGVPHRRRGADDRRRQRSALRRDLRRRRAAGARRRPALPHATRDRVRHRDELCAILDERLAEHDTAYWLARAQGGRRPRGARRRRRPTWRTSPQTEALGILQPLGHPAIPDLRLAALPRLVRRRAGAAPVAAARRRRAHRGDPARGGLRRPTRSRHSPRKE